MQHRAIRLIFGSIFLIFSLSSCHNSDSTDPNPRNAKATPGEAEVVADTGYQHTVFDSAKEKCQHCHNDLYDTWAQSGHSVAWKGPIFQGQFQNVVRARINQLNLSPADAATKTANQKTFKGRVQFCVKCHAPAAWYSKDVKIDLEELTSDSADVGQLAALKEANESNLVGPNYDPTQPTSVVGIDNQGKIFKSTLHIGHAHNREGVTCAYCHSIETVRMLSASGDDGGQYTMAKPLPNSGFPAGHVLNYSKNGEDREMNSFFRFAAAEIYSDYGNTPKVLADFDTGKVADGRHTIKSIVKNQHTGGPYYGPFGVTGLTNHNSSDTVDRAALVKTSFTADPESQHFEAQSKGLCLSCHQCALGRKDTDLANPNHFNTGCAIWQANSNFDNAANNNDVAESPKCAKCHMERVANKTVLHKWNSPNELFTAADGVTSHFDPEGTVGPVPEKYLNNHAFMATKIGNYGPGKLQSAVDSTLSANKVGNNVVVTASLFNKTGHFFPGTMPMRRALMRVIATDSAGNKLNLVQATGNSTFEDVSHQVATLPNEIVQAGHDVVTRKAPVQAVVFSGQTPDLNGSAVNSQQFGSAVETFTSPHPGGFPGPLGGATPTLIVNADPTKSVWRYQGKIKVRKIVDNTATTDNFTRIYGYQLISNVTGTDVIRPGIDSTGVEATSLSPNERESYTVEFDATGVTGPITVTYKAYYMTKGANTQFPTLSDGFLDTVKAGPGEGNLNLVISELFDKTTTVQ
ncbi:MAG: multiheme c-type cytochrome [Thiotrichaceae bacterium]